MSSIPVWLRLAFAALLLITIAVAFVGRPPRRRPGRRTWRRLAGVGAACYGIGCGALLLVDDPALSAALVGVGWRRCRWWRGWAGASETRETAKRAADLIPGPIRRAGSGT